MKRGFTLIELLAVIVILAIIALIATPIVLNIIDEAKDNASLRSAEFYLDAVENSIAIATLNNRRITDGVYYVIDTGNICLEYDGEDKCIDELVIEVKGEKPNSGEVTIENGKITGVELVLNDKNIIKDNTGNLIIIIPTPLECFVYEDNDDETISITGYTCGGEDGAHKDVVIPRKIDGKLVTIIGDRAFQANELTSVVIPDSVMTIGLNAFRSNQLTSVTIGNSVTTIGNDAFALNELTSVVIPDSVRTIGEYAFSYNQLTSVEISDSATTIENNAFAHNLLTSVVIPNSVTTIGNGAFVDNNLRTIEIPDGVTTIEKNAFAFNKLKSIAIPNSVTTIGNGAFAYNQLTSVVMKGKSGTTDFTSYGSDVFGWAEGYGDANITWQP